jgi:DNA mismatch repair protein MutS2
LSCGFNAENHILILSAAPMPGGKSVAMKSVGLLANDGAEWLAGARARIERIWHFSQIFADIGDQQSLDDDLSTYSSRLQNARVFILKKPPTYTCAD